GNGANVLIYDRTTGAPRQLTSAGRNRYPVWSPDGIWVAFQSDREGDLGIWRQRADGSGAAERLTRPDSGIQNVPESWSPPHGRTLLFEVVKESQRTLSALAVEDRKSTRVGDIQANYALDATFSPNGRWFAYRSAFNRASGVTVEPFPTTGSKFPIENG